jgi:hypothetical protein
MITREDRRICALSIGLLLAGLFLAFLFWGCPGPQPPTPPGPVDPPIPPISEPVPTVQVYVGVYDLLGATGDQIAFLDKVKANGGKGVRLFVCYSWQGPQTGGSPYLQVGSWTHDNGITFPLYRLSAWDENFWTRFNDFLCAARDRGLTVWIVVEDFCSLKGDSRTKYWNPMMSSEEALGPTTPGGIWGEAMKAWHLSLIDRTISAAKAVPGLEYLIEPMNEYDALDWPDADMIAWHAWAVDEIRKRGVPLSRIVGTAGRQASAIAAQVGLYSPHGVGRPEQIVGIPGKKMSEILPSSDGYWGGGSGSDCDLAGKCSFGVDGAIALGAKIKAAGAFGFEWLPRHVYLTNRDRANVDLFDGAILKALAFAK